MTTRSLILHDYEVRAALAGTLGLVVRPVSLHHVHDIDEDGTPMRECKNGIWREATCPLGVPGDMLRCKEKYALDGRAIWYAAECDKGPARDVCEYPDGSPFEGVWHSPATMPAWASRITLEVVGVRCVRVQGLTAKDVVAWGFGMRFPDGKEVDDLFAQLQGVWNRSYAKRGFAWDSNAWAWAVEVRRVEG